jgi:hypothetical protein
MIALSSRKIEKNDLEIIVARLLDVCKLRKQYELADLLDMEKDSFASLKSRGSLPWTKIELLCEKRLINYQWVVTGEGDPHGTPAGIVEEKPELYGLTPLEWQFMDEFRRLDGVQQMHLWVIMREMTAKKGE